MPLADVPSIAKPRKPRRIVRRSLKSKLPTPIRIKTEPPTSDMNSRERRAYYALCGDQDERREIVLRFRNLLEDNPAMTFPEAIYYYGLEKRRITFDYQSAMNGGRTELGGAVVDFILDMGSHAIGVLVNGNYWHNTPVQRARDFETKEIVTGQFWQGRIISTVIDVWESKLLSCDRDNAVDRSLHGEEVGQ